jgi:hypothetical protein
MDELDGTLRAVSDHLEWHGKYNRTYFANAFVLRLAIIIAK